MLRGVVVQTANTHDQPDETVNKNDKFKLTDRVESEWTRNQSFSRDASAHFALAVALFIMSRQQRAQQQALGAFLASQQLPSITEETVRRSYHELSDLYKCHGC
jgi:hypothetical protein